jgi:hypothetical protein
MRGNRISIYSAFEDIALKYKTDENTIKAYATKYKSKAKRTGKATDSDGQQIRGIRWHIQYF